MIAQRQNPAYRSTDLIKQGKKLVIFQCLHYARIPMFEAIARTLLNMMGHSGAIPSAYSPEDLPVALASLEYALQHQVVETEGDQVSLHHRAVPLIQLLNYAIKHHEAVFWTFE